MATTNGSYGAHLGVNLSFTKFLFVSPRRDDEGDHAKLRQAGACLARGFFNDFDAETSHDAPPHETIQFLVTSGSPSSAEPGGARYVAQVCSKYRPRLDEVEADLRRRVSHCAEVVALDGARRVPQYTSAELYAYAYSPSPGRTTGRVVRNAIIIPVRKTAEWWALDPIDRHAYFYPSRNGHGDVRGHARAAEAGISLLYRKIYHHPDGPGIGGQYDFIAYFECADEHLGAFDEVRRNLRNVDQNPEWKYVEEGREWRGHRVLRW